MAIPLTLVHLNALKKRMDIFHEKTAPTYVEITSPTFRKDLESHKRHFDTWFNAVRETGELTPAMWWLYYRYESLLEVYEEALLIAVATSEKTKRKSPAQLQKYFGIEEGPSVFKYSLISGLAGAATGGIIGYTTAEKIVFAKRWELKALKPPPKKKK